MPFERTGSLARRLLLIVCIAGAGLGLWGCEIPEKFEDPSWDVELAGPILVTRLSIDDAENFQDLRYKRLIDSDDMGLPAVGVVPAFSRDVVGPFQLQDEKGELLGAKLYEARITYSVVNDFPFGLEPGFIVEYSTRTGEVVATRTITRALPANGVLAEADTLTDITFPVPVYLRVRNIRSTGSNGQVVDLTGRTLEVTARLDRCRFEWADVSPATIYSIADTAEKDIDKFDEKAIEGTLYIVMKNEMPVGFRLQAYMLASDRNTIVDSLFLDGPYETEGAEIGAGQRAVKADTARYAYPLSEETIRRFNSGDYIYFTLQNLETGSRYRLWADQPFTVQLQVDLKQTINPEE